MSMLRYPRVFALANEFTGAGYGMLFQTLAGCFVLQRLNPLAYAPVFPMIEASA